METTNLDSNYFSKNLSDKEKMDIIRDFLLESQEDSKEIKELRDIILNSEHDQEQDLDSLKNLLLEPELGEMEKLKMLLFNQEYQEIDQLNKKFEDENFTLEISNVLAKAVDMTSKKDDKLSDALYQTIEHSIKTSVKNDPKTLADALFPVMGPAIRQSIASTFETMMNSMNMVLEQSFTVKGLGWRLEAMKTGKPFAEVVILNSLVFRVEQVFLIHKKTGLLLQHVTNESVKTQDADLVSGMLTAIQDFVQDSFEIEKDKKLDTLRVGELLIMIEQGPESVLAGIVRGNPNNDLREVFRTNIELIHQEMFKELSKFDGDSSVFEVIVPYLRDCLQLKLEAKKKEKSNTVTIIAGVIGFLILIIIFFQVKSNLEFNNFRDKLKSESGIVLTDLKIEKGNYYIYGLKDEFSKTPFEIASELGINKNKVISRLELYQSLEDTFILKRSKRLLNTPDSVKLEIKDKILYASGVADDEWIAKTRQVVDFIPGISGYNDNNVFNNDFYKLKSIIEDDFITFKVYKYELDSRSSLKLNSIIFNIKKFISLSEKMKKEFKITIVGYSSPEGTDEINRNLIVKRENTIKDILLENSISNNYLDNNINSVKFDLNTRKIKIACVKFKIIGKK